MLIRKFSTVTGADTDCARLSGCNSFEYHKSNNDCYYFFHILKSLNGFSNTNIRECNLI